MNYLHTPSVFNMVNSLMMQVMSEKMTQRVSLNAVLCDVFYLFKQF